MISDSLARPRSSFWQGTGWKLGGIVGLVIGAYLEWYFNWGPAATSPDRGAAHGYWVLLTGFPFTFVLGSPLVAFLPVAVARILLILGVGATWAIIGAAIDSLVRTRRAV